MRKNTNQFFPTWELGENKKSSDYNKTTNKVRLIYEKQISSGVFGKNILMSKNIYTSKSYSQGALGSVGGALLPGLCRA